LAKVYAHPYLLGHSKDFPDFQSACLYHDDGGGIYFLSNPRGSDGAGSFSRENYVHDLFKSVTTGPSIIAGLYLDQGSSGECPEQRTG
jgi:hypothetical protein